MPLMGDKRGYDGRVDVDIGRDEREGTGCLVAECKRCARTSQHQIDYLSASTFRTPSDSARSSSSVNASRFSTTRPSTTSFHLSFRPSTFSLGWTSAPMHPVHVVDIPFAAPEA